MSDESKKPDRQRMTAEHRTSPRYRLSSPPEVEILHVESGTRAKARLGNLSRGAAT